MLTFLSYSWLKAQDSLVRHIPVSDGAGVVRFELACCDTGYEWIFEDGVMYVHCERGDDTPDLLVVMTHTSAWMAFAEASNVLDLVAEEGMVLFGSMPFALLIGEVRALPAFKSMQQTLLQQTKPVECHVDIDLIQEAIVVAASYRLAVLR